LPILKLNSKKNNISDNGLSLPIGLNDKAEFENIYKFYWPKLYIYAFNILREREICEDIIQEVFVDLWRRRKDIQVSDLNSYLYRSVKNQVLNHFRNSKYKNQLLMKFNIISAKYNFDELYEKTELNNQISNLVSKLPDQRRLIFQLNKQECLSYKEISEKLNLSLQTVKNQISTALKAIRKSLKDFYIFLF
jgi:RNA polymerase sigma-19 factor, ECF subfamily